MKRSLTITLAVLFGTGCATYPGHATYPDSHSYFSSVENVLVVSEPPGAVVTVGAQKVTTPGAVSLDPASDHELTVTKDGYSSKIIRLDSTPAQLSAMEQGVVVALALGLWVAAVAAIAAADPSAGTGPYVPVYTTPGAEQRGEPSMGVYEFTLNARHTESDDIVFRPSPMWAAVPEIEEEGRADAEPPAVDVRYWGYKLEVKLQPPGKLSLIAKDATAALKLTRHYLAKGKYEEAKELLQKAVTIHPSNGELHYFLGIALGYLDLYEQSEEEFEKASALGYKP